MQYIFLSNQFYQDYGNCPEIEKKRDRPYVMVCIKLHDTLYAVPLRSHIRHKYVLWTDKANGCGLDFSKTVVLCKGEYIDTDRAPHIRQNEFDALRGKEQIVRQKLQQYINTYKKARMRMDVARNRQLCAYSTLQYFEEYL